jgi:hypothetical protein
MRLRNRDGDPVDAVPFVVVSGLAVAVCYSFGPPYCAAFGLSWPLAIAASTVALAGLVVAAYYRLVWTTDPSLRGEIPAAYRLRRLFYAAAAMGLLLVLLSLPLL